MAHTRDYTTLDGIGIKIANGTRGNGIIGDSQTVNVYDSSNMEGLYREVYRSREPDHWVNADQLHQEIRTLEELDEFLINRGFIREGSRR